MERVASQTPHEVSWTPLLWAMKLLAKAKADDKIPIDPPSTDLGPHLAYAVQWFLFFAVAAVGYPLVLRRQAKRGESEDLGPIDD